MYYIIHYFGDFNKTIIIVANYKLKKINKQSNNKFTEIILQMKSRVVFLTIFANCYFLFTLASERDQDST
jgi:hypothetical protein